MPLNYEKHFVKGASHFKALWLLFGFVATFLKISLFSIIETFRSQGPVSRKSRNLTGHFRVSQFPLNLKNGEDLRCQTSQLFFFLLP